MNYSPMPREHFRICAVNETLCIKPSLAFMMAAFITFLLTFCLAFSGYWIHLVVLVAVTCEVAFQVNTQLITHIPLQTRVHF